MYNFIDIILEKTKYIKKNHKDVITSLDRDHKFYYIKGNIDYILVVKHRDQDRVEKFKYSTSGVLLSRIIDNFDGNTLITSKELQEMYIENSNVVKIKKLIRFTGIERYNIKKDSWIPDPNIWVIDVETYLNNNSVYEIYGLGFTTNLATEPVVYYIDNNHDRNSLVIQMIDELLRPKYSNITFYCHNYIIINKYLFISLSNYFIQTIKIIIKIYNCFIVKWSIFRSDFIIFFSKYILILLKFRSISHIK